MIVWKSLSTIRLHKRKLTWKYWTKLFYCIKNLKSQLYIAFFSRYWNWCFSPKLRTGHFAQNLENLESSKKSQVREYSPYKFIFGLFLKARKSSFQEKWTQDLWCADKAFRIILLQRLTGFIILPPRTQPRVFARLLVGNKKWKWIVSMLKLKKDHRRYNSP